MTDAPPPSTPLPPPKSGSKSAPPSGRAPGRARGVDDVVLGIVEYSLAALLAFALLITPVLGAIAGPADSTDTVDVVQTSVFSLFILTLGFQILQGAYPWIYSRRRGSTIERDWRFVSRLPNDLAVGTVLAIGCFVGAQIATYGSAALVGLDDTDSASNTDILVDNQDSPWIIGVIMLVVVGAPLAEELLFRGLVLRTIERWFGGVVAIIGSSILFAIPHWQPDAGWQETVVLLSALAVVGLVFAIGTVVTGRLGPAVIAHFLFNATGTILTLL